MDDYTEIDCRHWLEPMAAAEATHWRKKTMKLRSLVAEIHDMTGEGYDARLFPVPSEFEIQRLQAEMMRPVQCAPPNFGLGSVFGRLFGGGFCK